ncbi:hypothetical protein SERLA73DRAFT_148176, partial [Serpula lacrymans var. lacrymans S7.3]
QKKKEKKNNADMRMCNYATMQNISRGRGARLGRIDPQQSIPCSSPQLDNVEIRIQSK